MRLKYVIVAVMFAIIIAVSAVEAAKGGYGRTVQLKPCLTEDQTTDCYWNAAKRGNHRGTSFVVLKGTVYLMDRTGR